MLIASSSFTFLCFSNHFCSFILTSPLHVYVSSKIFLFNNIVKSYVKTLIIETSTVALMPVWLLSQQEG